MVDGPQQTARGCVTWVWTSLVVALAFLALGRAVSLIAVSGYTAATDKPFDAWGVGISLSLLAVPVIVAVHAYRKGKDAGKLTDELARSLSIRLLIVGLLLGLTLSFLAIGAGP